MKASTSFILLVCLSLSGSIGCASLRPLVGTSARPDTALMSLELPDVQITSITHETVSGGAEAGDVTYYDVDGVIGGTIRFELLLPDEWNDRFVMGGGGGFVGTVQNVTRNSVKEGFATVGTDTGHAGSDGSFALDDAVAQANFGHVAVHRTAEVAKAIIRAHYGTGPKYSYFLGCSRGGGQAMMASQRYPEDFDGIVAGAPAFDWTGFGSTFLRIAQAFYPDPNSLDTTVLTKEELQKLIDEISLLCDEQDGLKDGIISNPPNVDFSLDSIEWLSPEQRQAIQTVYDGARNEQGQIYPGYPVGSEVEWFNWLVGPVSSGAPNPTFGFGFGVDIFKYFVFNDPDWDYSTYDFSTWAKDTRMAASTLNALDTDLSDFEARGGKLIIWHGWADAALPATATVDYYNRLLAHDPSARDFTRLYLIDGCAHCGGGPGISGVDWLETIVRWVENDQAPDVLVASKGGKGDEPAITRPLPPYPAQTVYNGTGDPNSADSFTMVEH